MKKVSIIGGGPAALMLAISLDETLFDITIYEKGMAPARKFLVAGDGGFNLTHAEDPELLLSRYIPKGFLDQCIRDFNNRDLQMWLKTIGIETFVGSSNRVFPLKQIKPIDVLNALLNRIKEKGISIKTKHTWKGWNEQNELIFEVDEKQMDITSDYTVFALGGASWSVTGSDGKWINRFQEKGIEIVPFEASNCAVQIDWDRDFISQAQGQALKNISITCGDLFRMGEVVLTRFGMEGGAIYAMSHAIRMQLRSGKAALIQLDLKPTLTYEVIHEKFANMGNHSITTVLEQQLKLNKLQVALLKTILSKQEFLDIETLAKRIKQLPISIQSLGSIDDSISTVGGIALHEVNAHFGLKKLPNHFAIGEMLDWDAPTGGYLLQAAFSMGKFVAEHLNYLHK
ncbi:MAG: TIGR03862 family flavoprotein [Bacteroidia bacterium]|jgi:hypothetical protein